MNHESWESFRSEVMKLIAINSPANTALESLLGLDSLALTEVCVLAEEELLLELSFDEVKKVRNLSGLRELVEAKRKG